MKAKVLLIGAGKSTLFLTKDVLEAVGWKDGEEVIVDIPTTHDSLIIFRLEYKNGS